MRKHDTRLFLGKAMVVFLGMIIVSLICQFFSQAFIQPLLSVENVPMQNLYATDGETNQNPYFSAENEVQYAFFSRIAEWYSAQDSQFNGTIYSAMLRDKATIEAMIQSSPGYLDSLAKQGKTLSDFWSYIQRMADIVYGLTSVAAYIIFFVVLAIIYFLGRQPNMVFVVALVVYLPLCIFTLSNNFLGYFVLEKFVQMRQYFGYPIAAYSDYRLWLEGLLIPMREAALTFIIVDSLCHVGGLGRKKKYRELSVSLAIARQGLLALPDGAAHCRLAFSCARLAYDSAVFRFWENAQWRALERAVSPVSPRGGGEIPTFSRDALIAQIDAIQAAMQNIVALEDCVSAPRYVATNRAVK